MKFVPIAGLLASRALSAAISVETAPSPTKYIFITGDSYTTTGFNISAAPKPSRKHPLGNPAYPGETLSGGENWVDIVVKNSVKATDNHVAAYNLAVGSNTVNISRTQLSPENAPNPIADMIDQVNQIEELLKPSKRPHGLDLSQSLIINWFGIDRSFEAAKPYLVADIGDYYNQLRRLYELGFHRFITVLVPPIHRTPVLHDSPKTDQAKNLTEFWNKEIREQSHHFLRTDPEASNKFHDPTAVFNNILDNFTDYSAPNNTCCSYPDGEPCLWHDFIHP